MTCAEQPDEVERWIAEEEIACSFNKRSSQKIFNCVIVIIQASSLSYRASSVESIIFPDLALLLLIEVNSIIQVHYDCMIYAPILYAETSWLLGMLVNPK